MPTMGCNEVVESASLSTEIPRLALERVDVQVGLIHVTRAGNGLWLAAIHPTPAMARFVAASGNGPSRPEIRFSSADRSSTCSTTRWITSFALHLAPAAKHGGGKDRTAVLLEDRRPDEAQRSRPSSRSKSMSGSVGASAGKRRIRMRRSASQLDRESVNPDQIRTVIRTFRDKLPEIFPGRTEAPKTLISAKTDSHADDIVQTVREEFGQGMTFARR